MNEKEVTDQVSKPFKSPADIKSYPKTEHRSSTRKRSSKILTVSPEKKIL